MKLIRLLFVLTLIVYSCNNDDDVTTPQCSDITNLEVTSIDATSATITWENSNSDGYVVLEIGEVGFVPGTGTSTQVNNEDIFIISALNSATTYDVYVTAFCSATNEADVVGPLTFTTQAPDVIAQFLPNLSELNLFNGDLAELRPSSKVFEYELVTPLFSDYSKKQRLIALPTGTSMDYDGSGFPIFPIGTVIAKTFYYNYNEQDLSQGRRIIETRLLINQADGWELGNYLWNAAQTEATLDTDTHTVPIAFINEVGETVNVNYVVPAAADCFTCHNNANEETVIGPKARNLNFDIDGINQLQEFIDNGYLINAPDVASIEALPDWENTSETLENRARAYFDVNCAHCHTEGGFCEIQSTLRLSYETSFDDSQIFQRRFSIRGRMQNYMEGFSMPFIGTTMVHTEGFALIDEYIDSLE